MPQHFHYKGGLQMRGGLQKMVLMQNMFLGKLV